MRQLTLLLIAVVTLTSCSWMPTAPAPAALAPAALATAALTKWEYKELNTWHDKNVETGVRPSVLNELGKKRWEVIQVMVPDYCMSSDGYTCAFYLLKRPLR